MVLAKVGGVSYHVPKCLWNQWEDLKDGGLVKADDDKVYIVDGRERSGKSLFAIQQAAAIDPSLVTDALEKGDLSRITFSGEETLKAIQNTRSSKTETKVIIFDEAFRGLSSRSALSTTNRLIIQALMEMGQSNLVLFIVLPSFFMLDRYPAVLRSNALFHVDRVDKKKGRGRKKTKVGRSYRVFNFQKKAQLYQMRMADGWGYPIRTRLGGFFYGKWPGGDKFEELYRAKKRKSLETMEVQLGKREVESKYLIQKGIIYRTLKELSEKKHTELAKEFANRGWEISSSALASMYRRTLEQASEASRLNNISPMGSATRVQYPNKEETLKSFKQTPKTSYQRLKVLSATNDNHSNAIQEERIDGSISPSPGEVTELPSGE